MRDKLDFHVAQRLLERFGIDAGPNELLWIEREIASGDARRIGVQRAEGDHGPRGVYALSVEGRDVRLVYDPAMGRVISVLPAEWRSHDQRHQAPTYHDSYGDPRRERRRGGKRIVRR